MKKFLKVVLIVIILFVLISGGVLFFLSRGLKAGSQLVTNELNLLLIDDGVYRGKYEGGRWSNEVDVEIKNHKINKITIINDVMFSKPDVIEELFTRVIDNQSVNVDVVSGATVTSKAYLKSIEHALKN